MRSTRDCDKPVPGWVEVGLVLIDARRDTASRRVQRCSATGGDWNSPERGE